MITVKILLGLALFAIGLRLFSGALKSLANPEWLGAVNNPWMMCAIALVVTLIVQSSSLTTSLLVGIAASGALGLPAVVGGLIGANLGTTLTAWIAAAATGMEAEARHAAMVHTLLNLSMAVVALPFAHRIAAVVGRF